MFKLPLFPMVGGATIPPTRTIPLYWGELTETSHSCGLVTHLPNLLTRPGVQITCALMHAASVMTYFVVGVESAWGVPPQVATLSSIRGSIVVVMIGRVELINNFCYKYLLLVSVTFLLFPSLV